MMRCFKIILSLLTLSLIPLSQLNTIATNILNNETFGYPHIKIATSFDEKNYSNTSFSDYNHPVKYVGQTTINWKKYAKNWNEFIKNYQTITFFGEGTVSGKNSNKKSFSNINIKISDIDFQNDWHDEWETTHNEKYHLLELEYRNSWTIHPSQIKHNADICYDAIKDDDLIKVRFLLLSNPTYDWVYSDWTESTLKITNGVIESSYDLQRIKKQLQTNLFKKLTLTSDYSGSLEEENNIEKQKEAINNTIEKTLKQLGEDYQVWKQYLQPFAFDNQSKQATIVFKFQEPNTKKWVIWIFNTPINIILTKNYWGKSLKDRLHITPGKIVNPNDSTKGMVEDIGVQLEPDKVSKNYGGTLQYHTSAHISFDGLNDGSEWMTVNGQKIEVLNNKFVYQMNDNRIDDKKAKNTYDIILHHDDDLYQEQYQVKYIINNDVPNFQAKWYAWNPENNRDQKLLIEPVLESGKPNPNYDGEINKKTGTKTQLLWIKQQSEYPFALDPLNEKGEVISNSDDYDLGFIAEGSVSGMGVQQIFNDKELKEVVRKKVLIKEIDESPVKTDLLEETWFSWNGFWNNIIKLIHDKKDNANEISIDDNKTTIKLDTNSKYWSWQGFWHYIIKSIDNCYYHKFVAIGQDYQNKYLKFLDVLNNPNFAVDFWSTIHGDHLKNYLIKVKRIASEKITTLSFEQVSSYWKEYTSDLICQRISVVKGIDTNSIDFITNEQDLNDLKKLALDEIKNNVANKQASDINLILPDNNNDTNVIKTLKNDENKKAKNDVLKLIKKQQTIIIFCVVSFCAITSILILFFRYRFVKGLGGKKRKTKKLKGKKINEKINSQIN